jgi:ribonucleoside-diphosphate reductase beta chain
VDEGVGYEALYRLWEADQWSACRIDLSEDAAHWRDKLDDLQRDAALWNYAMFATACVRISRSLAAQLDAAPGEPERLFIATQIADEARHTAFLRRLLSEVVCDHDGHALRAGEDRLTWAFGQLCDELTRLGDALRRRPRDRALLAQNVALCQLLIEGMLAIPGQRFFQQYAERHSILPGFATGAGKVARDIARHVTFGTKLVRELVGDAPDCRAAVLELLNRAVPWTTGVFIPPHRDRAYVECFGFSVEQAYAAGLRALEALLTDVGIAPEELKLISRDDRTLSYEDRAARLWDLIECGVLGDDRQEPRLSARAFSILFDGMVRSVDVDVLRSLGGALEWAFTDADRWWLSVEGDEVLARRGSVPQPALRLEISSSEWAKMVVGRTDSRWALVTRKLRIHGHLSAKAKLPRLFK